MIIIGERINSSRKSIKEAIDKKDTAFLLEEARRQLLAGASFIDINCAACLHKERDDLIWLIAQVQQSLGCSISIDSPDMSVVKAALKLHKGAPFINSITAEDSKLKELPSLVDDKNSKVIVLDMDEKGMPEDIEGRVALAEKAVDNAVKKGVAKDNIYIDPLVKPISTQPKQAYYFLEAINILKDKGINVVGGLSNVSFGLPVRGLLNAAFLKLAIDCGIDAVITDPTDNMIKMILDGKELPEEQFILAKEAILGKDAYTINYIKAFRQGRLTI